MTNNHLPDSRETQRLAKLMLENEKGKELNAMDATVLFNDKYGISLDWHIYSMVLDEMTRTDQATLTQGWGTCRYLIS